jgi:hypothetical protein
MEMAMISAPDKGSAGALKASPLANGEALKANAKVARCQRPARGGSAGLMDRVIGIAPLLLM